MWMHTTLQFCGVVCYTFGRLVSNGRKGGMDPQLISERLFEWRDTAGWSQGDVARIARLSPTTITHLENEHIARPRIGTIRKLAKAFGVTVDEFLEGPPSDPKATAPQPWQYRLWALKPEEKREFALAAKGLVSGPDPIWIGATDTKAILRLRKFMNDHDVNARDVLRTLVEESPGLGEALDRLAKKFARESREAVDRVLEQRAHA